MSGIVILGRRGDATNMLYHGIARDTDVVRVILEDPVSPFTILRRRVKRLGAIRTFGQLLFRAAVVPFLGVEAASRRREIIATYGLDAGPIPPERVTQVRSINSAPAIESLRSLAPAAVVISGTRILSPMVLGSVDAPFINIHAGMTPRYRGVHGGYWAIASGDPSASGVTVHLVDGGIDTGPVLAQARIAVTRADNFTTYPLLQLGVALPLLRGVLGQAIQGPLAPVPSLVTGSRIWSHPTAWGYLWSRLTRSAR
jgi:hypothetical protein